MEHHFCPSKLPLLVWQQAVSIAFADTRRLDSVDRYS